jgi:2-oxoglutarate dehydrogenase E1 component
MNNQDTFLTPDNLDYLERLSEGLANPPFLPANQSTPQSNIVGGMDPTLLHNSLKALKLINAFKRYGHFKIQLDPLGIEKPKGHVELELTFYGLNLTDSIQVAFEDSQQSFTLVSELLEKLNSIYCSRVGFEFMHLHDLNQRQWILERIEKGIPSYSKERKIWIFEHLLKAEQFEKFLHTKFQGAKRFSIEGGDSVVPLLESLLIHPTSNFDEIIFGMAHRGRLCILSNVLHKPVEELIYKFQGHEDETVWGSGDVKYHIGHSNDRIIQKNGQDVSIHVSLTANPSHLEAVNPVALGRVRAKQTLKKDPSKVLGILVHGDAAFAGQGLVAESIELSQLGGYKTDGTYHIIINNQIGFTTNPSYSRSTPYTSDLIKMIQAPIFHINGDDPEAVIWAGEMALEFKEQFKQDVMIDMVCYRRHGHNESDEPAFTQPKMYQTIKNHPTPAAVYESYLLKNNIVSADDIQSKRSAVLQNLQNAFDHSTDNHNSKPNWMNGLWKDFEDPTQNDPLGIPNTGVDETILKNISDNHMTKIPDGFNLNTKIARQLESKKTMMEKGEGIDWGTGELLAYASLINDGYRVRISGQDVGRGTFSHRHAIWTDQNDEHHYIPLNSISPDHKAEIINSPLSEASVLGFEYGYSLSDPKTMVIWEAQFGDFANGAQVIIDQFIAAGEAKWLRLSGLTMLLPHGYEGQGAEHSSARLERYLQLCGDRNMRVINCTTPANYFHALRRQMIGKTRKPLIVMTPKSLLRNPKAISKLNEFGKDTQFQPIIGDVINVDTQRIVICSGKVYYDLMAYIEKESFKNIAVIRLEQFYPFAYDEMTKILAQNTQIPVVWCQEEPMNMGAWSFIYPRIKKLLNNRTHTDLYYAGRSASAAPATGLVKRHELEQLTLVTQALIGELKGYDIE